MTHTSTEQQNKDTQEALDVSAFLSKYADAPSCQAAYHLKRLVYRVQELEASKAQRVQQENFCAEEDEPAVQLPEPAANAEGGMVVWNRRLGTPPIDAKLYTEHQVRHLLATYASAKR